MKKNTLVRLAGTQEILVTSTKPVNGECYVLNLSSGDMFTAKTINLIKFRNQAKAMSHAFNCLMEVGVEFEYCGAKVMVVGYSPCGKMNYVVTEEGCEEVPVRKVINRVGVIV